MHEPVRRHGVAFLASDFVEQSVAIEPEAQAFFVLDAEVIARQHRALRTPPLHGDTLGTFDADHGMGSAAPDEPRRRTVRHFGNDLDLIRTLEEPQRAQWRLIHGTRRPDGLLRGIQVILRRRHPPRPLRNMGVLRQMDGYAFAADARGNAVDQGRYFVIVVDIGIEIALLLYDDFGSARGQ